MTFTLKFTKLRAILDFPRYELPYWLGNKFRGGFGSVLFRAVCGYLKPECRSCQSRGDCLYYALYVREKQRRGKSQPVRPIVFIPPFFGRSVSGSGKLSIEINVFGDHIRYLPHIIYGLRFLGKMGLNSSTKYEIESILDYFSKKEVYDGESVNAKSIKTVNLGEVPAKELDAVKINFSTPIEAKIPISLNYLLHMVRRRLILYVNEYGEGEVPDYTCHDEIVESKWKNHRLIHRSKRGGMREFYGCTGFATYKFEADENAFKLLTIGELIGAGAKASFGMGFYTIEV